jgi:hypothetical protein
MALGIGGPHGDLDAGLGPEAGDLGGMDLGSAGFDVVEVTPSEDVDPPKTGGRREVAELVPAVGVDGKPPARPRGGLRASLC